MLLDHVFVPVFTGKIVLEALILTSAVVSSLTGYTFWASKRGKDFSFLGPVLFASLIILILTGFIQVKCISVSWNWNQWNTWSYFCGSLPDLFLMLYHCADVLPIWIYICCCVWCNQCYYFLRIHCLRHRQPHQALHLRWLHMGVCCSLLGHSELVHFHHGDPERVKQLIV